MSDRKIILGSTLTAIANAIRAKLGTTRNYLPREMAEAIESIPTGTDISDTTATASDVVKGKYFYNAKGTKTQGTLTWVEQTPSQSPQSMVANNLYMPTTNGYLINGYSSSNKTPSSSGTSFSSGWNYMNSSGYAYSRQPKTSFAYGSVGATNGAPTCFAVTSDSVRFTVPTAPSASSSVTITVNESFDGVIRFSYARRSTAYSPYVSVNGTKVLTLSDSGHTALARNFSAGDQILVSLAGTGGTQLVTMSIA